MKRLALSVATLSTTFISGTLFAADALTIRDLAPEKALLVVGADDVRGTIERLGPTAYGKLWNDASVAEEVKKIKENFEKNLAEAAAEAGIERGDMNWPSSLGLAVMAEVDEELGFPTAQFMFFCDWASEAEATVKMVDVLVARMEKDAKDGGATVKAEEIRGRRAFGMPFGGGNAAGGEGEDPMAEDPMDGQFGGGGPDMAPKEIYVISDKGRLFAASSVAAMDTLLARVDGDRAKSAGESETFKASTELAGGTQDVYAVLSTEAAGPILDTMPQFMLVRPLIARFFGDIKAWSFGLHAKDGVLEVGQGIYVPGDKVGLLSLADLATDAKAPPAIVPADAISYGRMNLRFEKFVGMIDEAIGGLPADQAEMIKPQLDLYRPAMQAAFAAMGPEIHMWGLPTGAEDPMSGGTVTAITMKNDKDSARAVMDFINLLPLGLQSRDFNGMTIMSDEFSPFAVGVGGGYLVIGSVKSVEQSLRSVDAKGEAGLASDEQFKQSLAMMSKSPVVGMAWWNTVKQMEGQALMMEAMAGQLGGMAGLEGDEGAEVPGLGVGMDELGGFMDLIKGDVVKRCFGDAMLEFTASSKGFSTFYRQHPAAAK
ncbi:MAG: hypothetical protein RLY21_737 [Planctomycetota bacterium]